MPFGSRMVKAPSPLGPLTVEMDTRARCVLVRSKRGWSLIGPHNHELSILNSEAPRSNSRIRTISPSLQAQTKSRAPRTVAIRPHVSAVVEHGLA